MKAKATDMIPNTDHKLWADCCQRKAGVSPRSDQSDTTELNAIYHARWVWGDYFACSYVWGETRENQQVEVNGVMHPVTDTCSAFCSNSRLLASLDGQPNYMTPVTYGLTLYV